MNGVIEGGSKVMLHRSEFGEREESQVGDYRTGFIVIAVLLKTLRLSAHIGAPTARK